MKPTHRLNPQALIVVLAMAFVVAAIWAATALAAGDPSSSSSDPADDQPAAELVQADEDAADPAANCPDAGSGAGDSESDSSGSISADL